MYKEVQNPSVKFFVKSKSVEHMVDPLSIQAWSMVKDLTP